MKRNTILTLVAILTISTLGSVSQGQVPAPANGPDWLGDHFMAWEVQGQSILFAGFNLMPVMPHGGVLAGIADACHQLRFEVQGESILW